jgi:hypothetical protein
MKTEFWYSVENGGDGSAYPIFMESKELAELHQKYMDEGWGEECIGRETIESDGPVKMVGVVTAEDLKKEVLEDLEYTSGWHKKMLEEKLEALNKLIGEK